MSTRKTRILSLARHHLGIAVALLIALGVCGSWATATGRPSADDVAISVSIDPRVELMSVIFRLAGNPEYGKGRIDKYTTDVEEWFGKHRDHRVVRMASKLRRTRGVSYDAVMSMAIHIKDTETLQERVPFAPHPTTLDKRWRTDEAREFLEAARDFAVQTKFNVFVREHRPLYEQTQQRLQKVLAEEAHLEWFESFFGARPKARFSVIVGLLNGGGCYGPRIRVANGQEELYCVLGAWSTDQAGDPKFDASMLNTVVHEFCHSYANAIVDRHAERLRPAGEKLFAHVKDAMTRQAYGNWRTMMYESLVRACTIRYVREHQGRLAAFKQTMSDRSRQFLWIGELASLLETYEKQRDEYDDLDAFAPRIVAFFDDYAENFSPPQPKANAIPADARAPKVVAMMPTNGAQDVDPAMKVLRVVFDRPMKDNSWSLVGGGPNFPKVAGAPRYDATGKIWTVAIQLRPNTSYKCMLNSGQFRGFQSKTGSPLKPVTIQFRTAPAR